MCTGLIFEPMSNILDIQQYSYTLPPDRIALYPLEQRDQSKLLVYRKGNISHCSFTDLPEQLTSDTLLIFNNTKVIQARILFTKETGASIEVFLLHPVKPSMLLLDVMQTKESCLWKCTIGNLKRWKKGTSIMREIAGGNLSATLISGDEGLVEFKWNTGATFASIVAEVGMTPLPPYLKRQVETSDKDRYQTVYSLNEGAVAAPTAGLHFTPRIFDDLEKKGIKTDFLTLHVSAGTFQPIKEKDALRHVMHEEQIVISRTFIEKLLQSDNNIIPVGTTSMRSLESLYWYGVKLLQGETDFNITQEDAYALPQTVPVPQSLNRVIEHMRENNMDEITGETAIYIRPGYTFRMCKGLITNFHQPSSTLILLIAALIGDEWRNVYDEALSRGYRFLSYGDSSLLLP